MAENELFLKHLAAIAKDFPPRSHRIENVEIADGQATLRIVPKAGFMGAPLSLTIPVSDDWDAVFLTLAKQHFMQRLFDPLLESHP